MAQDRMTELRGFANPIHGSVVQPGRSQRRCILLCEWLADHQWRSPSLGRSAITEAAQGFMTAFPDLMVYMDDLLEEGGKVIYKWTLEGTNSGPGGRQKPRASLSSLSLGRQ